jgi:thiol-disulfide isomerase/thioredoxin
MTRVSVCLLLCLLLPGCAPGDSGPPAGVGTLNADGRWKVINYWAIWCHPCRTEMPELNDFAAANVENVQVFAVNFDDVRGDALLEQAAELDIRFTLLEEDPARALGYVRPTVLPTTIIINPAGDLVARLLGPQTEASIAAAMQ